MANPRTLLWRAKAFRMMGDPLRLRLIEILYRAGQRPVTISQLARATGASQPLVSFHMKKLHETNLVLPYRRNRRSGYVMVEASFTHLWQTFIIWSRSPEEPVDVIRATDRSPGRDR